MLGFRGALKEGAAGGQHIQIDLQRANLSGADRDLCAGQGQKGRGGHAVMVNGDRRRHAARGADTNGGGWQVKATSRRASLFSGRRCGEQVQHRERAAALNNCGWGGGRME